MGNLDRQNAINNDSACVCVCVCVCDEGLFYTGAFGKVFRGKMRRPDCSKFEDIAIKTIKSELCRFFL